MFSKPQILSDCEPHRDFIKETDCGLIFKSNDAKDLAQKIEILINSPEKRSYFASNGKKAISEKYNLNNFKKNLLNAHQ
jgi:glycosyltransferase involved in cell wall biosynthesis